MHLPEQPESLPRCFFAVHVVGNYKLAVAGTAAVLYADLLCTGECEVLVSQHGAVLNFADKAILTAMGCVGETVGVDFVGTVGHVSVGDVAGDHCRIGAGTVQRLAVQTAGGDFYLRNAAVRQNGNGFCTCLTGCSRTCESGGDRIRTTVR